MTSVLSGDLWRHPGPQIRGHKKVSSFFFSSRIISFNCFLCLVSLFVSLSLLTDLTMDNLSACQSCSLCLHHVFTSVRKKKKHLTSHLLLLCCITVSSLCNLACLLSDHAPPVRKACKCSFQCVTILTGKAAPPTFPLLTHRLHHRHHPALQTWPRSAPLRGRCCFQLLCRTENVFAEIISTICY